MDKFISATAINAGLQLANQVTNVVSQHGLEKKRFESQLSLEKLRIFEQQKRDMQKQQFDKSILNANHSFQIDSTEWKAKFDVAMLQTKQNFDKKEGKKNRKFQREMIEKKVRG